MDAGWPRCPLFRGLWLTGLAGQRPYPRSKLSCFVFSPTASRMGKMRQSLSPFSLSRREQVGSTQSADCFACASKQWLDYQASDRVT